MEQRVGDLFTAEGLDDITPQQANVLVSLFQEKAALNARQLAAAMGISQVTVGRFVKTLESNGWIARELDPNDGRAMLVRLTNRAYTALPQLIRVSNTALDEAFAGLSERQITQLSRFADHVRDNLSFR